MSSGDARANRILLGVLTALLAEPVPLLYLLYLKRQAAPVAYAVLFPESPELLERIAGRVTTERAAAGQKSAARHCGTCHLAPPPDVLPRKTWVPVLRNMAARMGLAANMPRLAREEYGLLRDLKRTGLSPEAIVSPREFREIAYYYYHRAPKKPRAQAERPLPRKGAPFQLRAVAREKPDALHDITMVSVDSEKRQVLVGTLITPRAKGSAPPSHISRLDVYSNRLKYLNGTRLDSPPVHLAAGKKRRLLVTLGGPPFGPGRVLEEGAPGRKPPGEVFGAWRTILKKNYRLVHVAAADLDADGADDLILSGFGFNKGALTVHRAGGGERVLSGSSGAIRAHALDMNGDERPDVAALMAQSREGVFLHVNGGEGRFRPRALVEQHPAFGYTYLAIADLNGDGLPDLLTTNGDNGDFANPPLKYYHGVRLYLNQAGKDGAPEFKESWFYPLHGAFRVEARDFDLDGDLDLAVIALYDDAKRRPRENFVYFENTGDARTPRFRPLVVAGLEAMVPGVMDVGDLDGDGDLDVVLGALRYLSNPSLSETERRSARKRTVAPPMLMLLENRTR